MAKRRAKQQRGYGGSSRQPSRSKSAARSRSRNRGGRNRASRFVPGALVNQHIAALLPGHTTGAYEELNATIEAHRIPLVVASSGSEGVQKEVHTKKSCSPAVRPSTAGLSRGSRRSLNPNSPSQRRLHGALEHSNAHASVGNSHWQQQQKPHHRTKRVRPRTAGGGISNLLSSSNRSNLNARLRAAHDFGWK